MSCSGGCVSRKNIAAAVVDCGLRNLIAPCTSTRKEVFDNGATGRSDIEGKAAMGSGEEAGRDRVSMEFDGAATTRAT
jgi:hypothetical protein